MKYFTVEQIGPKQSLTPEGYLLCADVAVARTGFQDYGESEIQDDGITPPPQGFFRVERLPDEVFKPESLASWNLKPVVNEHPEDNVGPETWNKLSIGVAGNPRREGHLLLCDLVITNKDAIAAIQEGKRELSGGYNCDYYEIAPGHLQQRNIIGNHIALVDQGRCGGQCAIADHRPKGTNLMSKILDRLAKAFNSKDEKEFQAALGAAALKVNDEEPGVGAGSNIHVHIPDPGREDPRDEAPSWFTKHMDDLGEWRKGVDEFMASDKKRRDAAEEEEKKKKAAEEGEGKDAIEGNLELEAPPGTAMDKIKGAKDSALLADSFQDTLAGAELLAPGIDLPTFDRKEAPKATFDRMCGLRRKALDHAMAQRETLAMVQAATGGRGIDTRAASCRDIGHVFRAVVGMKKAANNTSQDTSAMFRSNPGGGSGIKSIAELNKLHATKAKERAS